MRENPIANRRLYRLISVHHLGKLGLAFDDIAEELGITARHAGRLFKRKGVRSLAAAPYERR